MFGGGPLSYCRERERERERLRLSVQSVTEVGRRCRWTCGTKVGDDWMSACGGGIGEMCEQEHEDLVRMCERWHG